jgi:hypothetical protein
MAMTRRLGIAALLVVLGGALWYLRDPPWLAGQTTGLRGWAREPDGTAYRWSGGHASFFVPADARQVRIPIATTFDPRAPRGDEPMMVTFTIDDVRAGRALLADPQRQEVTLEMPAPGSRRVRRIDVRTNLTRENNHGVKIGEIKVSRDGVDWRPCCS